MKGYRFGRIGGMRLSNNEENQMVDRLLNGEKGAVRFFYKIFAPRMKRYLVTRTKKVEDAEEILQDVLLAAIESLPLFNRKSKLFSWLCGIARHEIADYYRKKRVKLLLFSAAPVLEDWLRDDKKVEEQMVKEELRLEVEAVLERLLPRYAQVLRMKYLEGWSVKEMAEELGESFKATETALFRARKAFAIEWSSSYEEAD